MYTIGEFSRITSTTIKALRHYHDKGILVPSFIEKTTNYRYYNHGDVDKARIISTLKTIGFSLSEILMVMNEVTQDSDLSDILYEKKAVISAKIKSLNQASSTIDLILTREQEALKMTTHSNDIQLKQLAEVQVLATRWQGPYSDSGKAMGKVYRCAGRHHCGPAMNLYFDGEYKEIADIETCLPVKKAVTSSCNYKILAGGQFLTITHTGSYETISSSYEILFEYINQQGITSKLPFREVYIKGPGMIFKGNPNNYITEIQIPIAD